MEDSDDEIFCGLITEREMAVAENFYAKIRRNEQRSVEDECEMVRSETTRDKAIASTKDMNSTAVDVGFSTVSKENVLPDDDYSEGVQKSTEASISSMEMNTTLDAINLLLKHGVDYMMCPDDSVLEKQDTEKPTETRVEEKAAEQSDNPPVLAKTLCKNARSPMVGSSRVQSAKYARTPAERRVKPVNIRSQNLRNVVSPVASYIKNRPPPALIQTVRAYNSKTFPQKVKIELESPPQWAKGLQKPDVNNGGSCATPKPVLPVVSYEKAPGVNMNTMDGGGSSVVKGNTTGMKLMKYTGRALLGSIPELAAQDFKNPEVSRFNI